MLERENHELKTENRKIKHLLDANNVTSNIHNIDKQVDVTQGSLSHNRQDSGNIDAKKELFIKLLKTSKLLEKYVSIKKSNAYDQEFKDKIKQKIPQFENAIRKLTARKNEYKFDYMNVNNTKKQIDKNFTMVLNSTVNDTSYGRGIGEKSFNNTTCNESFNKSVKSLLNSMKTDNLSRKSDQNYIKELKQNSMADNEKLFEDKIETLQSLLRQLKE